VLATLVESLRSRRLLLVLDNCEHLIGAASEFAETLLRSCPEVRFLVTSREALGIAVETAWRVPSLSVPDDGSAPAVDRVREYEAVQLFETRAQASDPGFQITPDNAAAVVQVCRRLDGIPLAIELAAARVRVLGVDEILSHLHERFRLLTNAERTALPRQQTLGALIQWSYDLLGEEERSLFRRLSAFRGSFALEAASAVSAGDGARDDYRALDLLTSLADKSLLTVRTGLLTRYRLLETIREFAAQKAAEKAETAVAARRHAAHFAAVAQRAYREFDTSMPDDWLERNLYSRFPKVDISLFVVFPVRQGGE